MKIKLNARTMFFLMCIATILVVGLAVAAVYFGNTFMKKESDKLVALKLQYKVPEQSQTVLKQAKADIQKYTQLENTAKTIVPQDKDQARSVREIANFADATYDSTSKTSIVLLSITFPASNLGQTVAPVTSTPAAGSAPVTPKVVTPSQSQVQPVPGITGVYQLPITVISDPKYPITFGQLTSFLQKLEQNRRTAQVSQISINPQTNSTKTFTGLSFTLTVNVYIKP